MVLDGRAVSVVWNRRGDTVQGVVDDWDDRSARIAALNTTDLRSIRRVRGVYPMSVIGTTVGGEHQGAGLGKCCFEPEHLGPPAIP